MRPYTYTRKREGWKIIKKPPQLRPLVLIGCTPRSSSFFYCTKCRVIINIAPFGSLFSKRIDPLKLSIVFFTI